MGVTDQIFEPHDHEVLAAIRVSEYMARRQGTHTDMEGFRQEALDEFHKAGLDVDVKVWSTTESGTYAFDFELVGRLEGQFDPDMQVWEATHDILGLGEKGFIKTPDKVKEQIAGAMKGQFDHSEDDHIHGPETHSH
jgi:hypothetical protein